MAITLNSMRPARGAKKGKKRVGRGLGSTGTTAGRGQKGQKSRSGVGGLKLKGMRNLMLSIPKRRGFHSLKRKSQTVNLTLLQKSYVANEIVSPRTLAKKGLIMSPNKAVKVLSSGELSIPVTIKNCLVSAKTKEKVLAVGGKVEV